VALGLIQPVTEMSTRNISCGEGGKDGRCLGLTTLRPSCVDCLEIWKPQPPGTLYRPVIGFALPLPIYKGKVIPLQALCGPEVG